MNFINPIETNSNKTISSQLINNNSSTVNLICNDSNIVACDTSNSPLSSSTDNSLPPSSNINKFKSSFDIDDDEDSQCDLPICQSYSDLEESLRLSYRNSKLRQSFLSWFYKKFIYYSATEQSPSCTPVNDNNSLPQQQSSTFGGQAFNKSPHTIWSLNYREAAIYLEEGYNNDKFDYHPHLFPKLPAYLAVHNHVYYLIDLLSCFLILSLALFEKPASDRYHLPEFIHASMELFGLFIIGFILWIKYYWIGARYFVKHTRTLIKTVVLCLMVVEAVVVLLRQDSHFRVTRSLRPVFLIDNYYFNGVRRVVRQTIQSLRSFIDMLLLLLFFLIFFSISAFYLFSEIPDYPQFSSFKQSFISLFVLLTTSNFPDVMMPAYKENQLYALFFVIFLAINLYFLLNIMLAVVYNSFTQIEKEKFRKLLIHRRKACDHAFRLLVTQNNVHHVKFRNFNGLLEYLKPNTTHLERYLMYKSLVNRAFDSEQIPPCKGKMCPNDGKHAMYHHDKKLTLEKFYHIYEVLNLRWKNDDHSAPWFDNCWGCVRNIFYKLRFLVLHRYFKNFTYTVIACAAMYQLLDMSINHYNQKNNSETSLLSTTSSTVWTALLIVYTLEMFLKLLALGPTDFFSVRWNCFDVTIISTVLVTFLLNRYCFSLSLSTSFLSFRSLRLLDLLRSNVQRYRDILGPFAFIIIKRFISVTLVVLIVYYFFAIIAMECFGGYQLVDCCQNTSIENYFRLNGPTTSYYYLNNFNDLVTSYITLFELMVVNNWQILMMAYVIVTENQWTAAFFIIFYIISLVVITIVIAFVLDTFQFHIQYKDRFGQDESSVKISINVALNQSEWKYFNELDSFCSSSSSEQNDDTNCGILSRLCRSQWPPKLSFVMFGGGRQKFKRMNEFKEPHVNPLSINVDNDDLAIVEQSISANIHEINCHQDGTITGSYGPTMERNVHQISFRGTKIRDKFSYNLRMYSDEIQKWLQ